VLLLNVYMPTDYGDDESLVSYVCTCAKITALYEACVATRAVVVGDFNCQHASRFFNIFKTFASDNNHLTTDLNTLVDAFTYRSDCLCTYCVC